MAEHPSNLHNQVAPEVLGLLLKRMSGDDIKPSAMMVVLESVVFGAMLFIERHHGAPRRQTIEALNMMTERVEQRLADDTEKNRRKAHG